MKKDILFTLPSYFRDDMSIMAYRFGKGEKTCAVVGALRGDEVQQLYVDNADIRRRMRDTHTKLRLISPLNSTCPDNDRFPLAQALIEYDTRYRHNWNVYDHYVKGTPVEATVLTVDPRTEQRNHVKTINLLLGKYARNPNDDTAKRIKEIYAKIASPSDTLRAKMEAAALL